ncbi:saccharopine dehydrogenase [Ginsengibacter hankyongi]|uniref:Saccharopine dehydrogenase n=1 Tax=Ginsengibacter hankyongi TaxID=2607284 RepID=A0A5J5IAZ7_9BACT|nr:saccharopine dehydrogenase C-terminal domain-containing protein [Ginsengibacter hankyongi]KAA9034658.1 saccharopine dehydrogenase [Ginsengibacter hankyongi]
MKNILLFGAGKSATCLIDYLCAATEENNWLLVVCDADLQLAQSKIQNCNNANAVSIDVSDEEKRIELIKEADIVISMLPPHLHFLVANDCLNFSKHLLTASYIDEKIKKLNKQIEAKGLLFLCEMGLDPGIDHMSAMKIFDQIKKHGGKITSFKSHCGGLVSPESDDNPWHYKITWNPANIVMAGSSGAIYKMNGSTVTIPYHKIFDDNEVVDVPGLFPLAWYPNRDSLSYIDTYGLQHADTFIRTTLRHASFCRGWNIIVNSGLTDLNDYEEIKNCKTYNEWFVKKSIKRKSLIADDANHTEFDEQANYLSLRSNDIIEPPIKSSASLLQNILEKKLAMQPHDKDMIVMLHEIDYEIDRERKGIKSCLIVKGDDQQRTAMAKTVGLPLGIAAKLILQDKIKLTGLHIPVAQEIYEPVLAELELNQIKFNEEFV